MKKSLPIGISEYQEASTEYYYVDKTLLIRDFLDERPKVSLFTRPRRFGKTLNMDMLGSFLRKQRKILRYISGIKRSGPAASLILTSRENTR